MMTYTFGSGSSPAVYFFDYNLNENLLAGQVDGLYKNWSSPHLWKKYGEIKTEMIGHMLPLLLKQRIRHISQLQTPTSSVLEVHFLKLRGVSWDLFFRCVQARVHSYVMAYCLLLMHIFAERRKLQVD